MRITSIRIGSWRHFQNITIQPPDNAPVVCLVGGNGTGKSQILELIAACAQRVGLSAGSESSRRDPFQEQAEFVVDFSIAPGTVPALDAPQGLARTHPGEWEQWTRGLTLSHGSSGSALLAQGVPHSQASGFANAVVETIRQSESVHYLALDADRAYPKVQVPSHEVGQAFERDWDTTHKQSAFRMTRNLYDEWFRYLIAKENQENNRFVQRIRLARDVSEADPIYVDQFDTYKHAIRRVLPHLLFVGIDSQKREICFDSTGIPLSFNELSGGEREIAFLIGQIERFSLRKGLLLVDEPELHLNYDLLRSWIGYLKSTVELGQIWLATHSLEVVEVTGQDATFLLERDSSSRRVNKVSPLNAQPVIATLSRAVGSPAFSISALSFVLVEGEEEIGERERFRIMCDVGPHVRFMEAGSCTQVVRRVADLKHLAEASGQPIRIGGVVDGDWRGAKERSDYEGEGVFVLGVHEIENLYLHPETLRALMAQIDRVVDLDVLVMSAADLRAGAWIFAAARADRACAEFPPPSKSTRELAHRLVWSDFRDVERQCAALAASDAALTPQQMDTLRLHLIARTKIYDRNRQGEIWRTCEGKEVFRSIVKQLGFSDEDAAERAIAALWRRRPDVVPEELRALRRYVSAL